MYNSSRSSHSDDINGHLESIQRLYSAHKEKVEANYRTINQLETKLRDTEHQLTEVRTQAHKYKVEYDKMNESLHKLQSNYKKLEKIRNIIYQAVNTNEFDMRLPLEEEKFETSRAYDSPYSSFQPTDNFKTYDNTPLGSDLLRNTSKLSKLDNSSTKIDSTWDQQKESSADWYKTKQIISELKAKLPIAEFDRIRDAIRQLSDKKTNKDTVLNVAQNILSNDDELFGKLKSLLVSNTFT